MRLALRRGASEQDVDDTAAPRAAFAGVYDGHLLWVAVPTPPTPDGTRARLALRHTDGEEVVELPTERVVDRFHLGARIDLAALDGAEARHDVVLVDPVSQSTVALTTDPVAPTPPGRPSLDGRTRHAVVRSPEGTLRVRTTLLPAAAGLLAVRKLDDALELTLVGAGPELALLADDGQVLVSWPVDAAGVVTLTSASIAHLDRATGPAVSGSAGRWQPVRRRVNDLLDPRGAAPLPQLDHPQADRPRLRLPWSREATLLVRVFALDEPER